MADTRIGPACVFGDNINTDIISPPQYMELTVEQAAPHAMSGIDPDFAATVRPGTILVAGRNFGSGSSRELAPLTLRHLGVSAIVAEFFARIFYRNAINLGLPVVECAQARRIAQGDELHIDFAAGRLHNLTSGEELRCSVLPPHILELIREGGLIPHLRKRLAETAAMRSSR